MAELRGAKARKIREFNARTKGMPKDARAKARREFKQKVNAQMAQISKKFPTARGQGDVAALRRLLAQLQTVRAE